MKKALLFLYLSFFLAGCSDSGDGFIDSLKYEKFDSISQSVATVFLTTPKGDVYCKGFSPCGNSFSPLTKEFLFPKIATAVFHTCALTDSGKAFCWGDNNLGQLGNGELSREKEPVPVVGDYLFKELSAGGAHTCGLTQKGDIYCWGSYLSERLKNGDLVGSKRPMIVPGNHRFKNIYSLLYNSCGLTDMGEIYCWGILDGKVVLHPILISGEIKYASFVTNGRLFCALDIEGTIYCTGTTKTPDQSKEGNFWDFTAKKFTPIYSEFKFKSLAMGSHHICGIEKNGKTYCWGEGKLGQLGNGVTSNEDYPMIVSGKHSFGSLSLFEDTTCGITEDKNLYCWGRDLGLTLDDNNNSLSSTPQIVKIPTKLYALLSKLFN